jgi:hypothetical protein
MDTENEQFGQFLGVIDSNKINNKQPIIMSHNGDYVK